MAILAVTAGSGCDEEESAPTEPPTPESAQLPPPPVEVPDVECPTEVADCETAGGSILFVERIDPDGDGDAHFVLLSREGITAPGISVIDVRTDLRPKPLPGPGDLLAGAGPVFEGSFGQRQIQAEVIAFDRVK